MTSAPESPPSGDAAGHDSRSHVLAAGGVVIDRREGAARVLVVHRPAYDDWSLPKGHVESGEAPGVAALREVAEETGVQASLIHALGTTEYAVGARWKTVHWFLMHRTPNAEEPGERDADAEVDIAAWWDAVTAQQRLTHTADRELVRDALAACAAQDRAGT